MTHSFTNNVIKLSAIVSVALCLIFYMCGCASKEEQPQPEETEATQVYNTYTEKDHSHMQIDGNLTLGMVILGYNVTVPLDLHAQIANSSNYLEMAASVMHLSIVTRNYLVPENDNYAIYSSSTIENNLIAPQEKRWLKAVTDVPIIDVSSLLTIDTSFLANADLEIADNTYEVSVPLTNAVDQMETAVGPTNGYVSGLFESLRMTGAAFEKIKVKYVFDQDCNLTRIYIPETVIPLNGDNADSNFNIALDITISYDENAEITVPDEVMSNPIDVSPSEIGNTASEFFDELRNVVNGVTHTELL